MSATWALVLAVLLAPLTLGLALVWRDRRALTNRLLMLHGEAVMLRDEAAALARTIAASGKTPGSAALSTPLVYPAVAADLGRFRRSRIPDLGEFHARLAIARTLLASQSAAKEVYPLLSHLVRAVTGIEPALREMERRLAWPETRRPDLGDANRKLEEIEMRLAAEAPDRLDRAYLWMALPK
jgi:hypothetical protein